MQPSWPRLPVRAGAVADLLGLLRDQEQLVEINGQIFLDAEVAGELHRRVLERLADGTTITMAASATCWARPGNLRFRLGNISTASD